MIGQSSPGKRVAAEKRNNKWASLLPGEQLRDLNQRFPNGANRQKERIQAKMRAYVDSLDL